MSQDRFDADLYELIPHRPPMLLINKVHDLSQQHAESLVYIDQEAPFFDPNLGQSGGIPSWIGVEYMGQTAALIAGYQVREGLSKPHLGFLLGMRKYQVEAPYFTAQTKLLVRCEEAALVGESLATFNCTIDDVHSQRCLATASLSVFRKPKE